MSLTGKFRLVAMAALVTCPLLLATNGAAAAPGAERAAGPAGGMFGPSGAGFDFSAFKQRLPEGCHREADPDGANGPKASPEERMKQMAEALGLTGQQQQDIQIVTSDYATRFQELTKINRNAAEQLAGTEPEDANYWPLTQEVSASAGQAVSETVVLLSEMRQKISQILTAEQRAKIKAQAKARAEAIKARCKPDPADAE